MVVPLLFLACTQTCTNTCTETSQRTRKSTRTLFVVKQREETVTDLEKCCTTTQSIQPLHSQSQETSGAFPLTERTLPSAFLELMTARKHILRLLWIPFCVSMIFATLLTLSSVNEAKNCWWYMIPCRSVTKNWRTDVINSQSLENQQVNSQTLKRAGQSFGLQSQPWLQSDLREWNPLVVNVSKSMWTSGLELKS